MGKKKTKSKENVGPTACERKTQKVLPHYNNIILKYLLKEDYFTYRL